jgi:PTS system fructose-specific IIC component
MVVANNVKIKFVSKELRSTDKYGALKELVDLVKDSPILRHPGEFLEDVLKREAASSTEIGEGVAIPHARTKGVQNFVVCLGISPKGIDFSSGSRVPVKLVFLIGIPADKMQGYLSLLSHITHLVEKREAREQFLSDKDPREIADLFQKGAQLACV